MEASKQKSNEAARKSSVTVADEMIREGEEGRQQQDNNLQSVNNIKDAPKSFCDDREPPWTPRFPHLQVRDGCQSVGSVGCEKEAGRHTQNIYSLRTYCEYFNPRFLCTRRDGL